MKKLYCILIFVCALSLTLFAQNTPIYVPVPSRDFPTIDTQDVRNDLQRMLESRYVACCPPRNFNRGLSAIAIQFFGVSGMRADFSEFENVLGVENIEFLNNSVLTFNLGVDYFHRGFNAMLQIGGVSLSGLERDERIRRRTTTLGLQLGYRIIDTRHFFIRPDVGINFYRIRLTNGGEQRNVCLEDFVNNRDLDLRFHQFTGYGGLTVAWKVPSKLNSSPLPLYLTLSGGYHFRLNNTPRITSVESRIRTDNRINVSYGFSVGLVWVVSEWW